MNTWKKLAAAITFSAVVAVAPAIAAEATSTTCPKPVMRMGSGGGMSSASSSSIENIFAANDMYEKAAAEISKRTNEAQAKSITETIGWLDDCIAGLNTGLFAGDFTGIFDKIIAAIKKKICNFAQQQTQEYLNAAIAQVSYDLPYGLGTVGANSSVLGYKITSTTTTGNVSASGVNVNAVEQKNAGIDMFNKAGGIFVNSSSGSNIPGFLK